MIRAIAAALLACLALPGCGGDPPLDLGMDPPKLRIEPPPDWRREPCRAFLVFREERVTIHLLYDPEDGGPRVRDLAVDETVPWPEKDRRPAVAIVADPNLGWRTIHARLPGDRVTPSLCRLYLAGRTDEGAIDALPFITTVPEEIERLTFPGAPTVHSPLSPIREVLEIRITPAGDEWRIRWGSCAMAGPDRPRFDLGDRTWPPGFDMPHGLGVSLGIRSGIGGTRKAVYLEVAEGIPYEAILGAVEAAKGDPRVLFFPWPLPRWLREGFGDGLPRCDREPTEDDWLHFREDPFDELPVEFVNVRKSGKVARVGKSDVGLVRLRAHEDAPWKVCREALETAVKDALEVQIAFAPAWPGCSFDRVLQVDADDLGPARDAPDDAKAGPVLREILERALD